ncbi:hypothetical protein HYH02_009114 [Chlamydomonas schloesseri]|uniref:Uncharacterized protein n=1 Tax=Chlamydomonas schloesseri TaxID=2026947 RepID=A0A835WB68_9CHLO|nr:hypothetical protein HYH02_009114 [Chlamydomonas schloesseri]|eukprot:KAG2444176.1 hypothetical protein HYH02_009114 [Chlamydomonas schloesseri]
MLRRRWPARTGQVAGEDEDDASLLKPLKQRPRPSLRVLVTTLVNAVWSSILPPADVASSEYSEYLTERVKGLTIGWHIFRTVTEGAFLASYGLAFNTVVVQIFWMISVSSVVLHFAKHKWWLAIREWLCVNTNRMYGVITVLKIFHLVPRLPNENNYMFKHCFLTMADAAFAQTPVHRQYLVQFAEAAIRCVVWRRYHVLPNVPTWGVICISFAWQIWLVTFASMLQARHVSAFRRQRRASRDGAPADANTVAAAAGPSTSAAPPSYSITAEAAAAAAPMPAPAGAVEVGEGKEVAEHAAAARSAAPSVSSMTATSATGSGVTSGPTSRAAAPSRRSAGSRLGPSGGSSSAAADAGQPQHQQPSLSQAQQRYMTALRCVARGPSSYVLLSHQRRQAGANPCATAQFYIPAASPEQLPANWRERLAVAVAENAPGWQLASACVRTGSLIVHLDLVYVPPAPAHGPRSTAAAAAGAAAVKRAAAAASADTAAAAAAAAAADDAASAVLSPFTAVSAAYTASPFVAAAAKVAPGSSAVNSGVTDDSSSSRDVLDGYLSGMSAESLMELLGLAPEDGGAEQQPVAGADARPVSLQIGDSMCYLASSSAATSAAATTSRVSGSGAGAVATTAAVLLQPALAPPIADEPAAQPVVAAPAAAAAAATQAPQRRPLKSFLSEAVRTALAPPAELRSREYAAFLSARVGQLHLAYAGFMCFTAAAFCVLRAANGVRPLTLVLFLGAEVLTLAAHGLGGGRAWRAARCGLVYAGVALRSVQMLACTVGFLPHMLRDTDCVTGRWVQKVLLVTTLQALCMQPPVRTFFAVRLPSVLMAMHVHVVVCQAGLSAAAGAALHLGWEAVMFVICAGLQLRHLEAFRCQRITAGASGAVAAGAGISSLAAADTAAAADSCGAAGLAGKSTGTGLGSDNSNGQLPAALSPLMSGLDSAMGTDQTPAAAVAKEKAQALAKLGPGPEAAAGAAASRPTSASGAAPAASPLAPCAASGDPTAVSLSAAVVALAPRRAARLQLQFTCTPAVLDELHVVLRHVSPASMATGVHAAHAARDITHALAAPIAAAGAAAALPAEWSAELTLVAAAADVPGVVHVEIWRGRRRVVSNPVLLVAAPQRTAAVTAMDLLRANGDRAMDDSAGAASTLCGGACASGSCSSSSGAAGRDGCWVDDITAYVSGLEAEGHGAAAAQFIEELGSYLAQVAAVERGLAGATASGGAGAGAAVANVLYFHGLTSDFMYLKPRAADGSAGGSSTSGRGSAKAAAAAGAVDPTFRQLLLCQGSMLLAVAAEAGCTALSAHLLQLMTGPLAADAAAVLDAARTPVTQLPLLHAAVKSGRPDMVDLVAQWSAGVGLADIWAQEAAVLAVTLSDAADSSGFLPSGSVSRRASLSAGSSGARRSLNLAGGPAAGAPRLGRSPSYRSSQLARSSARDVELRIHEREVAAPVTVTTGATQQQLPRSARGSGSFSTTAHAGGNGVSGEVAADAVVADDGAAMVQDLLASCSNALNNADGETPFRIIAFRGSGRAVAAAPAAAVNGDDGAAATPAADQQQQQPEGVRDQRQQQQQQQEAPRTSLDGGPLVDGGVVVLTPLHLALALGDNGALASHILRTYPEAAELLRVGMGVAVGLDDDAATGASASACGITVSGRGHASALDSSGAFAGGVSSSAAGVAAEGECGNSTAAALAAAAAGGPHLMHAFNSMPGLGRGGAGGAAITYLAGGAAGDCSDRDSMDCNSMQSMSLSEVAFLEGMRWVNQEEAPRRPGFKVTKV